MRRYVEDPGTTCSSFLRNGVFVINQQAAGAIMHVDITITVAQL